MIFFYVLLLFLCNCEKKKTQKTEPPPTSANAQTLQVNSKKCVAHETPGSYFISRFGDIKYEKGFKHFDYANPTAPKGVDRLNICYSKRK